MTLGGREVSHPLRDWTRLTNPTVEGGVVGLWQSSNGWLFLTHSSSSKLIPLFTPSFFPYSPDVFPSWKSKGFTSPLFRPHSDALASLWGELEGWRWEGQQLGLSNYSIFKTCGFLGFFCFFFKNRIVPFSKIFLKCKISIAFYKNSFLSSRTPFYHFAPIPLSLSS